MESGTSVRAGGRNGAFLGRAVMDGPRQLTVPHYCLVGTPVLHHPQNRFLLGM